MYLMQSFQQENKVNKLLQMNTYILFYYTLNWFSIYDWTWANPVLERR